jgi:hypothetical protein
VGNCYFIGNIDRLFTFPVVFIAHQDMLRVLDILGALLFVCTSQAFCTEAYQPTPSKLSDQGQVSILTCGPGEAIYSLFGHTALRIQDLVQGIDRVYNYGTFDFNTPNFSLKFARGNLDYFLSTTSFERFLYEYQLDNRVICEQVLNLNQPQLTRLYHLLEENLQPGKKYYRYQFFADNCTTRIYQLLARALEGKMQIDTSSYRQGPQSFRQLFTPYLQNHPWVRLGMNIGLGLEADQGVSFVQSLYLPANLEKALTHSYTGMHPLVKEENILFTSVSESQETSSFSIPPLFLFTILALIIGGISLVEQVKGLSIPLLDYLIFGATGIVGLILLLLWLFSLHTPTYQNVNLLWLLPLHLFLLVSPQRGKRMGVYYAMLNLGLLSILLLVNPFFQLFVVEFYPIALILMIRFWLIIQKKHRILVQKLL